MDNLSEYIKKIRAAAYCRVSTEKDDQLASLETQRDFFIEYTKLHNYQLIEVYADEGISGTKLKNRTAFNKMMNDARAGKFDRVFVKDISRFARNAVDFLNSIRELKAMGIKCDFVNASLSTEDGEFTLGILALVAQEESANISKRIKFGKEKNAQKGRVPNLVYGYNKKSGNLFSLEINKAEAEIINQIYTMYINNGYGAAKIAHILNKNNIKTKRGYKWSQNAVSRILQNPLYTGIIINGKEEVADFLTGIRQKKSKDKWHLTENPSLKIIENELFKKAQQLMLQRKALYKVSSVGQSNKYPFSRLLKCGCCGYSFRRIKRRFKTKEYIKWACSGRNTNGKEFCGNHTYIDEKELFREIKAYFISQFNSQNKLMRETEKKIRKKLSEICCGSNICNMNTELERLSILKKKQTDMYEADIITIDELKNRTAELNTKIYSIQKKLELSTASEAKLDEIISKYCQNAEEMLVDYIFDNHLLKCIINTIIVHSDGKIEIQLN